MTDLIEYLANHAVLFDKRYINYADARYDNILKMVEIYDKVDFDRIKNNLEIKNLTLILGPLIEIKNYKSQIPFPVDFLSVIERLISIRKKKPIKGSILRNEDENDFKMLLSFQGFQLPTVSAIYHFCWPDDFPIVDKNVEAACAHLKKEYSDTFLDIEAPCLPYQGSSSETKAKRYFEFIEFITKIKNLDPSEEKKINFRFIDKALMVLGGGILSKSKLP